MNSLMFTFSADQMSNQLGKGSKINGSPARPIKKRPSSSNPLEGSRNKSHSSNINQLFENSNIQNCPIESSPERNIGDIRIKNSSIQIQQKRKLRNIIDNMLGKNFDSSSIHKLDSVVISNRKNIIKNRGFLNGSKKYQQNQSNKQSKQNQFNFQNMDVRSEQLLQHSQNDKKKRPNIKIKKFEFANLKMNKLNQANQRYMEKNQQTIQKRQRQTVNMSRQSIDRSSLGKQILRSKTPKIMYPQSDSKLPSVFKQLHGRNSSGNSVKRRTTRITSAQQISEFQDKRVQDTLLQSKRNFIQIGQSLDPLIRTKFRPQSMMLQSRKNVIQQKQVQKKQFIYPKKLVFDCNQDFCEDISRKLGQKNIESKCQTLRMNNRAKSYHGNYAHRKLKQMNSIVNQPVNFQQKSICQKNLSHFSRQTAQQSIGQSSTDRTMINLSGNESKNTQNRSLGCSITFHISKE